MWVDEILKCPDSGAWIALTYVNSSGDTLRLGYATLPFRKEIAQALDAAVVERADDRDLEQADMSTWTSQELVDFVLEQLHRDLPVQVVNLEDQHADSESDAKSARGCDQRCDQPPEEGRTSCR